MMVFSELVKITGGKTLQLTRDSAIQYLVIDSRRPLVNPGSVFFAIAGLRNDGHQFIHELYDLGIRQFVVEKSIDLKSLPDANIIHVNSSTIALQQVAASHRANFKIPVIGITGSNGKTIVKEWLYQLLSPDFSIVKSPGSYNSQVGVPLAVWEMQSFHQLGIFEAGISKPDEMVRLEKIIKPTIGIFTNIGPAHDEGFENRDQKINEKLVLFSGVDVLITCEDQTEIVRAARRSKVNLLTWGKSESANVKVRELSDGFKVTFKDKSFNVHFPFVDKASLENVFHCITLMLSFGFEANKIQERISSLQPVSMRLELKEGINNCQIIDDSYNNDLAGLQISLDFLSIQQKKKKTIVLSDVLQTGVNAAEVAKNVHALLGKVDLSKLIVIGSELKSQRTVFNDIRQTSFYDSTDEFLKVFDFNLLENEVILVKGARVFQFEKIVQRLQRKAHGTIMQIDLSKMVSNLNYFKSKLKPGVKIMGMVKAFAYGSGSEEVANLLQYHKVDYLGVAYADEGVELRKKNITIPIMVMNPSEEGFESLISHNLEPVMYSVKILKAFSNFLAGRKAAVHLEVETGMHRLGMNGEDLNDLVEVLYKNKYIQVASVFSHLSASDEAVMDGFSQEQFDHFQKSYALISSKLNITPLRHILNSAGILRLPDFQLDMVRLGIGLYGVNPTQEDFSGLQPVATLKTVISQIKTIHAGETVGYGRKGKAHGETRIATIAIGYADGFSRSFSQGKGFVLVNGQRAPVIGNVCMDMTMIDITGISASEGDEVIIFGEGLSIHEVAESIHTIPYEILTSTSSRVKRVFTTEGI